MSLISFCPSCKQRTPGGFEQCPGCGANDLQYIIDYRPSGRYGKRIRQPLPVSVNQLTAATEMEKLLNTARKKKRDSEPVTPKGQTVKDLFPIYIKNYSALYHRPQTHDDVNKSYNNHYSTIIGHLNVTDTDDMQLYIQTRKAQGVKNRTINKELAYYARFRTWCEDTYKIPRPVRKVRPLPAKRPKPMVLSIREVVRIFDAADPFYKAYFSALFTVGLRLNEASNTRRKDIDLENRVMRIEQKGGTYKILPLSDWFIDALVAMGAKDLPPDSFIWSKNRKKNRPVKYIYKALARTCKKGEIDRHVTPHLFRHSVATYLLGHSVNLRSIQELLGHSSINTTEFYTHVEIGHLEETQRVIQKEYDEIRNEINNNEKLSTK